MFNKPSEKININNPDPNSDIYISEGERFNKDFAAYDYNRRNIAHERKKEIYQNRKNILYERERKRWEKMDYEYLRAENKIMMNKERNLVGRKNNPGMAFNPLTLQYDNSVQGEILKRRDDESKFRALMRATNIDKHANAGYNIINGEERNIMENRMINEIEPSVYKNNIDKINEINKRHNDNDNFYTKGPSYSQQKNQFQQMPAPNEYVNENDKNLNINEYQQKQNDLNNMPPNNERPIPNEVKYSEKNDNNIPRRTPNNNIPPNENYQRGTPNNNRPPNDDYQRMTPHGGMMPPNENYQKRTPINNYNNMPPNNNYDNYVDNREYGRTPYNDNNYRKMTPSNHGYNRMPLNEEMMPDHYSEQQDRRYQNMRHDFDRQYNYIGNQGQNNYEDYKNEEYYNRKQSPNEYYPKSENYNPRDRDYYSNRDPYERPDYYENNRPRTMG